MRPLLKPVLRWQASRVKVGLPRLGNSSSRGQMFVEPEHCQVLSCSDMAPCPGCFLLGVGGGGGRRRGRGRGGGWGCVWARAPPPQMCAPRTPSRDTLEPTPSASAAWALRPPTAHTGTFLSHMLNSFPRELLGRRGAAPSAAATAATAAASMHGVFWLSDFWEGIMEGYFSFVLFVKGRGNE